MSHALGMHIRQCLEHLLTDVTTLIFIQLLLLHHALEQISAIAFLLYDIELTLVLEHLNHSLNIRMIVTLYASDIVSSHIRVAQLGYELKAELNLTQLVSTGVRGFVLIWA